MTENNLFGITYDNEAISKRVGRIEADIFGKTLSSKDLDSRLLNLKKILAKHKAQKPKSIEPFEEEIRYPILDEIEQKLFGQRYQAENIHNRLDKLEEVVFGQTFKTKDLADRVTALKKQTVKNAPNYNTVELELVEKLEEFFLKKSYSSDNIDDRLARLELEIFNEIDVQNDINSRVERLGAIAKAQASKDSFNLNSQAHGAQKFNMGMSALTIIISILMLLI